VPDLDWYFSYCLFRLTGIVQGIEKRIVDGTASSAQAERSAAQVYRLAKASWDFAVKAGAE
jgi:aminoglycoside phosphotransferase (APT) family kinase protein